MQGESTPGERGRERARRLAGQDIGRREREPRPFHLHTSNDPGPYLMPRSAGIGLSRWLLIVPSATLSQYTTQYSVRRSGCEIAIEIEIE